jgi:hypothetical protein
MPLTATVRMTRAHLAPVSNMSTGGIICGTSGSIGGGGSRSDTFEQSGDFRTYANGVTRLVTGTATSRSQSLVLRALPQTDVVKVQAMVGKTCLFRDTYGRKVYGSFLVTSITDTPLTGDADGTLITDIAITFQSVTYTEEV